jgi:hypothetical protein
VSLASLNNSRLSLHRILRNSQLLKNITWRSIWNFKYLLRNIGIMISNYFTPLKHYGRHRTEFRETCLRATFSPKTNFCAVMQENPTQSSIAEDASQTERRTDDVADVVFIQDAFPLLPKRHLKCRCKFAFPKLILSTINVTYRQRCNDQYNHSSDESSSLVCLHR